MAANPALLSTAASVSLWAPAVAREYSPFSAMARRKLVRAVSRSGRWRRASTKSALASSSRLRNR